MPECRGVLVRLEVVALCKAAGFSLDEIRVLLTDDHPGRPSSRSLAEAKLSAIDAQMATLGGPGRSPNGR